MIDQFYYSGQLRDYIKQFCAIFSGLRVQTGIGECDVPEYITVPTVVGNKDRVVAAIMAGNTQNRVFALPIMAAHLQSISMAPERRKAPGYVDRRVHMPVGGVFPDDLRTVKRAMPVPFNVTMELSVWASNSMQLQQILEQVLVLFNPQLQLQKNDRDHDWTKLVYVELTDISNEENYPSGADKRVVAWTLTFTMPIWLSIPMAVKDDLVRKIIIQIGELSSFTVNEVDAMGNLTPFGDVLATVEIDTRLPEGEVPFPPRPL